MTDRREQTIVDLPRSSSSSVVELYEREYEPMLRLAFLLLGSLEDAQEATQDAFVKVLEKWERVDNHGAYLRTCVLNRCRNRRRRLSKERRTRTLDMASYDQLGARELLDALATLPYRQRAAIVLRFYEGASEADIAASLDVPPGTVKSSLSRGLANLRKVVEL